MCPGSKQRFSAASVISMNAQKQNASRPGILRNDIDSWGVCFSVTAFDEVQNIKNHQTLA
jgi:hypothetical protein